MEKKEIDSLKKRYDSNLSASVIPFWDQHSIDREMGGYFTCLERDGRVFDTDKFMWLQAREVWMYSKLFTSCRPEKRWGELAKHGADFMTQHGRDRNGDWYFALDRRGRPLVEAYNIFSDCFAAVAFAEYHRASGDPAALEVARSTYNRIQARKENPKGHFNKQIGETRSLKAMALPMIQIWMAEEMGNLLDADLRDRVVRENIEQVTRLHIDRKRKAVFERVAADGSHPSTMDGRLLTPGHALEVLWFILRIAGRRRAAGEKDAGALVDLLTEAILYTAERGWDSEYGGFYYYMDYEGFPPEKLEWDMKLWWVHAEALCAFLLAYQLTGNEEFLEWFRKTDSYVFDHFVDPTHGEWYGYLHRDGSVALTLKGGKWKGFFHTPRALLTCMEILDNMAPASKGAAHER